jgi:hypothetical protein
MRLTRIWKRGSMLPVNAKSKLTATNFVDHITNSSCITDWMKAIFSTKGNDLKIADKYSWKGSKPPGWFDAWFKAASAVWQADEWELTTGVIKLMGKGVSIMEPDGLSIGKPDPTGGWVTFMQIQADDSNAGGLTVPTQSMKADLNADKDKDMHYAGVIVKPSSTGKTRGGIIVVDRFKTEKGDVLPRNSNEITSTLFHELFHAGQISQGQPNAHKDKRFEKVSSVVDAHFAQCAHP